MDTKITQKTTIVSDQVFLPYAPKTEGIIFRRFRGEADYPHILASINASKEADGSERSETLEDIARNYEHLHNCDPYQDMLFAEVDGKVAGYCRNFWEMQGNGTFLGLQVCFVAADQRGKGIGTTFLKFTEGRIREYALARIRSGEMPADTPCYYDSFVSEKDMDRKALLENNNYPLIRYAFDMVRPDLENIPEAPMPEGLVVRTPHPNEYRKVWDASNEAFRDHWGFIPQPEEEYEKWLKDPIFKPELWRVAWDGDEVAGMVLNFINENENREYNRKRGWTENICVRRPYRRKGLARSLIAQSLQLLKEVGMDHAALGVDAENVTGALHLYMSTGFKVVKQENIYRKQFYPLNQEEAA